MEALEVVFEIANLVDGAGLCVPQLVLDGIDTDSVLGQKVFVFFQTLDKVPLTESLLAPTWWQGRDDAALDTCLDAVGAGLLLVTTDLSLLAEDTGSTTGELDDGRVKFGRDASRYML